MGVTRPDGVTLPPTPSSILNNTAPAPGVRLRIVTGTGEDIAGTKLGEKLFSNCLLVHKLLATGRGEELLERWDQISPSILLYKCQYVEHPSMLEKKVAIPTLSF